jgi:uncharacterized LabA/DUF88 family protein
MDTPLCRIGVFFDGVYFIRAQKYFYHDRGFGWLELPPFLSLLEQFVRASDHGYANYRVVCSGWYQGVFPSDKADAHQLRRDRDGHMDLIRGGIEPRFLPMSQSGVEKGVDVALAIDALQAGLEHKIDVAVLVTGDADQVPLARALMKQGIRAAVVYFDFQSGENKTFANDRLLKACNYTLNVNALETDPQYQQLFRGLFRRSENSKAKGLADEDLKAA